MDRVDTEKHILFTKYNEENQEPYQTFLLVFRFKLVLVGYIIKKIIPMTKLSCKNGYMCANEEKK